DSTLVYQGYGRELDLDEVRSIIRLAVGDTEPELTILLKVDVSVSEARRAARDAETTGLRDRFEEADRAFFERVEAGYDAVALAEPDRIKSIDATQSIADVGAEIRGLISGLLKGP
ncbi:MAG: dTMP kinase, partial [Yoonia sp.]